MIQAVLFENCKLFRDIAHHRSVSRGAELNEISQSAASQHLHDLERKLGVALLDRSTRPLALTPAGRHYFDLCREVVRREEEFLATIEEMTGRVEGEVRVVSIYSVGLSEMARIQEEFQHRFPDSSLHVSYMRPNKIYEALAKDQADLGLVSYPEAGKDLVVIPWRLEDMLVVVAPNHPLAKRTSLVASDLNRMDFIGFDQELNIRREIDRYFRERDVDLRVIMEFDNIQMVKEAISIGSGVSILPARTLQVEMEQGRLVGVPIQAPELRRPVGIVHRRRKRLNRAMHLFIDMLRQIPDREPVAQAV
jgi:DNA-binding transcriptional LysR family regulator